MTPKNRTADGRKPQFERDRREVTGGGAERERRQDRAPVERLAPPRGDRVDVQRALAALPAPEHDPDQRGEERRRDRVGEPQAVLDPIGDHRPEDRHHHHREPIGRRVVLTTAILQPERQRGAEDSDEPGHRNAVLAHEVRHRLPHPRRQDLQDPEHHRDLGNLRGKRLQAARTTAGKAQQHHVPFTRLGRGPRSPRAGVSCRRQPRSRRL